MMLRTLLLLTCSLMLSCAALAQHPADTGYRTALKLYNHMVWQTYTTHTSNFVSSFYTVRQDIDWLQPAIAIQRRNRRGNFHEVELSGVRWRTTDHKEQVRPPGQPGLVTTAGYRQQDLGIALRYEYILVFGKRQHTRIKAALGLAVSPYVEHSSYTPYTTSTFPGRHTVVGVRFFAVPRFTFALSRRVFADANLPICLTNTYTSFTRNQNPTLPAAEQRNTSSDFVAAPGYFSFRVGLGVVL